MPEEWSMESTPVVPSRAVGLVLALDRSVEAGI